MAVKIPAAVAISALEIMGAITSNETCPLCPSRPNASRISTTVPNSPIKGDVEAIILRNESPIVACLIILFFQIEKIPSDTP